MRLNDDVASSCRFSLIACHAKVQGIRQVNKAWQIQAVSIGAIHFHFLTLHRRHFCHIWVTRVRQKEKMKKKRKINRRSPGRKLPGLSSSSPFLRNTLSSKRSLNSRPPLNLPCPPLLFLRCDPLHEGQSHQAHGHGSGACRSHDRMAELGQTIRWATGGSGPDQPDPREGETVRERCLQWPQRWGEGSTFCCWWVRVNMMNDLENTREKKKLC